MTDLYTRIHLGVNIVLYINVLIIAGQNIICPLNEQFTPCLEGLCTEKTCAQRGLPIPCPDIRDGPCTSGCICADGFLRNDNGLCIPALECPGICPQGEKFTNCMEFGCQQLNCAELQQTTDCEIITDDDDSCTTGCICPVGFLRNDDGVCVPRSQCPQSCNTNEEFSSCTQLICRAQRCSQRDDPISCSPLVEDDCNQGCVCIDGTLRNSQGICVPEDQCEDLCPVGEEFTVCVQTICRAQDCSQVGKTLACPNIELCDCQTGCVCPENFVRNAFGTCIPQEQCPRVSCPVNEEFSRCKQALCRPVSCSQRNFPLACPAIEERFCETGCVCSDGFLRDDRGVCVPEDSCPGQGCGTNEIFNPCANGCQTDACPGSIDYETYDDCVAPAVCLPQCQCAPGYKRDAGGICIPQDQCPGLACGVNEVLVPCANGCNNDACPTSFDFRIDFACSFPPEICVLGCQCAPGYKRDPSGICIPQDQCPGSICGVNEILNQCANGCSSDACPGSFDFQTVRCIAFDVCLSQCECAPDFKRDANGVCIPQDQCPGQECGVNEIFVPCANGCNNDACFGTLNYQTDIACIATDICVPGCLCAPGYKRDTSGICVPQDQCPGNECGVNEIFNSCGNGCQNDACPGSVDFLPEGFCVASAICLSQCQCAPSYKRNADGICIPQDQCPGLPCGVNEILNPCANGCFSDACPTSFNGIVVDCVAIDACFPQCQCAPGFYRDNNGVCVPQDQCPGAQCGANEILVQCASGCNNDACPSLGLPANVVCFAPDVCVPGCQCASNYKRNANGICIPQDQCPGQVCGVNEIFNPCGNGCQNDACPGSIDYPINIDCFPSNVCIPECQCAPNYQRNANGICIPQDQCPGTICGVNEIAVQCANGCNNDACPGSVDYQNNRACFLPDICLPGCQCAPEYKRDARGICIPEDQCPGVCGVNEIFNPCGNGCQNDACPGNFDYPSNNDCIAAAVCLPQCQCDFNFRRNANGVCVPIEQCEGTCGKNEILNLCPSVCNDDSCPINLNDDVDEPCILICGPPRCECIPNFKRDFNGNCIPIANCPAICPENEEFSSCIQEVCRAQTCSQVDQPIRCSGTIDGACQQGCICVHGTLRDENGNCIPQDQCTFTNGGETTQREDVRKRSRLLKKQARLLALSN